MRFREKDAATTSKSLEKSWLEGSKYTAKYTEMYTATDRYVRMLDVETPSFHRERNKGGIICSPMFKDEIYYDVTPTSFVANGFMNTTPIVYKDFVFKGLDGVSPNACIVPSGMTAELDTQFKLFGRETSLAITRAHAEVNLSEMNVLASTGELPETIAWMRNCIKRILELTRLFRLKLDTRSVLRTLRYNAVESGKSFDLRKLERYVGLLAKRKARRELKKDSIDTTILNLWLEYRYAVRPLVIDLKNALNALDKVISSGRLTARGREYVVGETSSNGVINPNANSNSVGVTYTKQVKTNIKARAGCLYVIDGQVATLLDVLGLDQPIEAVWELIPFSFMLDWVFSIGDLLESWFKSSGLSVLASWVTLRVESSQTCKVTSAVLYPGNASMRWPNQQFVLGSSHTVVRRYWRYPSPPLPLLPRFDLKLDLAKLIDLGAIYRNIYSGKSIPAVVRRN